MAVHYAAEAREAQARADNAARFADRAAAAAVARAKHAERPTPRPESAPSLIYLRKFPPGNHRR